MAGYADELISGAPAAKAPPAGTTSYADELFNMPTGALETRRGPEAGPVVDDLSRGAGFWTTARASLAPEVGDQIKRFAEARGVSPDLYGVLDGEIVYYDQPSGKLVREVPSLSVENGPADAFFRLGRQVAASVGPSIPGVAGGIAGTVAGPTATSIPVAAGAAGAADLLRQMADRALAGEPVTDLDYLNAAGQAGTSALGQAAGITATKMLTRNPLGVDAAERTVAKDFQKLSAWEALRADAKNEGVPLTAGELTDLPSLKASERALRRFPETADGMARFIQERNTEAVPAAMRRFIGAVPPSETATAGMIGAADDVIRGAVDARSATASPLYEKAFASGVQPDVRPVVNTIVDELDKAARNSTTAKALTRVRNMLGEADEAGSFVPEVNYRRLHSAKLELDNMLADLEGSPSSADRFAARALTGVQKELTDILRQASPDYEAGYQAFIAASPMIDELRKGGVGVVARLSGQERSQLLDAIFSANRIAPGDVLKARVAFDRAGKGAEWNDGLNAWLSGKLERALTVNASGQPGNVPGKIVASVWGDPRQREIVKAAIGDPQRVNGIERLMEVLRAAARSLPEGSPTATDTAAMARMTDQVGRGLRAVGKLTSPNTLLEGGNAVAEAVVRLWAPKARRQLAKALMSTDALDDLKRLQLMSPRSQKAFDLSTNLLTRAGLLGGVGASGINRPVDRLPPAVEQGPRSSGP